MKQIQSSMLALVLILVAFTSCKKDDTSTNAIVKQGTWRVTLYSDDAVDETSYFTNYTFTFGENNVVTATNSTNTVTGTWTTGIDDSTDKLYLEFGAVTPFDEISDDWDILESTSTKVRLNDVSGGNGGIDSLTFEKL